MEEGKIVMNWFGVENKLRIVRNVPKVITVICQEYGMPEEAVDFADAYKSVC